MWSTCTVFHLHHWSSEHLRTDAMCTEAFLVVRKGNGGTTHWNVRNENYHLTSDMDAAVKKLWTIKKDSSHCSQKIDTISPVWGKFCLKRFISSCVITTNVLKQSPWPWPPISSQAKSEDLPSRSFWEIEFTKVGQMDKDLQRKLVSAHWAHLCLP